MRPLLAVARQFKQALVGLFALLLGGSAWLGAFKGLLQGAIFCLLCRRGSPALPFAQAPGLYLVSLAMLLALGAIALLAAWVCWRELTGRPVNAATPARAKSRSAARAQPSPRRRAAPPARPRDRPGTRPHPPRSGLGVHLLGGALLLGAALLGVTAWGDPHSSADLSFATVLLPLSAFGLGFLGALVLMNSPRPSVAWLARAVVALVVLAGLLLKLMDGRHG